MPLVAVVAVVTGVSMAMVHMPALLGITFGFIMNATSPGIIVAQMLLLTSNGYGITNGTQQGFMNVRSKPQPLPCRTLDRARSPESSH